MGSTVTPAQRVLVVDDSPQITELIAAWLSDLAIVSVAYSGTEAWQAAIVTQPHVLIVDIVLPGLSGFDLVDALRQRSGGFESQVIFITGLQEPANTYRAMELGAMTVLHKPLDPQKVREAVLAALHSAHV